MRRRVKVGDPTGLHARPCAALAKLVARARDATLKVRVRGVEADGGSILDLLGLVAAGGEELELVAEGPGAAALLDAAADVVGRPP
ncbi:MAG: HPr family phosphocarrier protein [Planctomycetia bacterium]|nr:HPr family phosphocarrier protein [Planctomycetia bacterium]